MRDLPWRQVKNPYVIWVSEIIMQQTRIAQGLPYFNRFIDKFPTVEHLANASIDDVLLVWQGLGYYSRARNMHQTAQTIVADYKGMFPKTAKQLQKLKGIGEYTAAAISSFCFNEKVPAIDGNVYRIISRIYDVREPVDKAKGKTLIYDLVSQLLPVQNCGDFNQALMDFGAMVCTPRQASCNICPLASQCQAKLKGTVEERPIKSKITKVRQRYFMYLLVTDGKNILIQKRDNNDIWKGLYELPLFELEKSMEVDAFLNLPEVKAGLPPKPMVLLDDFEPASHKLSHQTIHAKFLLFGSASLPKINGYKSILISNFDDYAFPKLIERYLNGRIKKIMKTKIWGSIKSL
ncbi:MAG: A/G-specific adenine glycosylase [Bacteroidetes bacterium HGW-Bacteroidetes-4]|nr:MAG: A/G-specific adenine glycosylase [Bacteroidetes bacterium HGW-Bacteroidetes-4]